MAIGNKGGGIQIDGLPEAEEALKNVTAAHLAAYEVGITKAGLHLQAKSQKQVPVDTGALRSSAYTKINQIPVTIGEEAGLFGKLVNKIKQFFGRSVRKLTGQVLKPQLEVGYTQKYAIYVHENLTAHHPVGKAKFLEDPAREEKKTMLSIVEKEVNNVRA